MVHLQHLQNNMQSQRTSVKTRDQKELLRMSTEVLFDHDHEKNLLQTSHDLLGNED